MWFTFKYRQTSKNNVPVARIFYGAGII